MRRPVSKSHSPRLPCGSQCDRLSFRPSSSVSLTLSSISGFLLRRSSIGGFENCACRGALHFLGWPHGRVGCSEDFLLLGSSRALWLHTLEGSDHCSHIVSSFRARAWSTDGARRNDVTVDVERIRLRKDVVCFRIAMRTRLCLGVP